MFCLNLFSQLFFPCIFLPKSFQLLTHSNVNFVMIRDLPLCFFKKYPIQIISGSMCKQLISDALINQWFKNCHDFGIHSLEFLKYSNLLSICTWFLQFSSLKYTVWWTWFSVYFKLEFHRLWQAEKSSSN